MVKILFVPPILVALFLVVMNWSGMYQTPDIIGMPVVFEIMAFLLFFAIAIPFYWFIVLPGSYLTLKLSASRFGGLVMG